MHWFLDDYKMEDTLQLLITNKLRLYVNSPCIFRTLISIKTEATIFTSCCVHSLLIKHTFSMDFFFAHSKTNIEYIFFLIVFQHKTTFRAAACHTRVNPLSKIILTKLSCENGDRRSWLAWSCSWSVKLTEI